MKLFTAEALSSKHSGGYMADTSKVQSALIVVAHPLSNSLSHTLAERIAGSLSSKGISPQVADIHQEQFSPAMSIEDVNHYRGYGELPSDVAAEQARIDGADMLVVVFPVYWWSVPAVLKGWVERVFTGGWAFKTDASGRIVGNMRDIPVRLIATGAADKGSFDRHGYTQAIQTQIIEGVFGFCGLRDTQISMFYDADKADSRAIDRFIEELAPMLDPDTETTPE
ncbi:NAD(P)H-dependent oxidoreductase [Paraburkholderia sp. A3BS-1L]|uniref:NAD(P)H-dependent oxidoreductase n=1 Tax=Paraburkholderia sp. A3BS-1L TaxID=3028375 RepID=UPI003DA89EE6